MNEPYLTSQSLENLYDIYSPVMYGIALQITSKEAEAEKILSATFQKLASLNLNGQGNTGFCLKLIKLTIETACEICPQYKKQSLRFRQFLKTPVLYRMIYEIDPVEVLCREYGLTAKQLMEKLRGELSLLSSVKRRFVVKTILIPG